MYDRRVSDFLTKYGPWALVAGASEGLGEAFADRLAFRGMNLVLVARRKGNLDAVAERVSQAYQVDVRPVVADLSDPNLATLITEATQDLEIGTLVYNAAHVPVGSFVETDPDSLTQAIDVNVRGPVILVRSLLPAMCERKRGAIVLMSSVSGMQGMSRLTTYAASKSFNTILAEGLWHELRNDDNVDVVVCCAGAIPTPGYRRAFRRDAPGMLDPLVVADTTLASLGKGPRCIPGFTNKLVSQFFTRFLPRRTAINIMSKSSADLM